jgi:hypothetical protein
VVGGCAANAGLKSFAQMSKWRGFLLGAIEMIEMAEGWR